MATNYTKNATWVDGSGGGTLITAAKLNHLEDGVAAHTHDAADVASGTVATARLGSGTASSSTFLRGDQTWATPSGAGALDYVWAYNSANQSYSVSTLTAINWDAEVEDATGYHDNVTNKSRFTVPAGRGGLFDLKVGIKISGTSVADSAVSIYKNGGALLPDISSPLSGATAFTGAATMRLAAGDYIEVNIFTNGGSSLTLLGKAGSSGSGVCYFMMTRIGS